jgi:hypothetical protein
MIPDESSAHKLLALMNLPKPKARPPNFLCECDCRYLSKRTLEIMIADLKAVIERRRASYAPASHNLQNTITLLESELSARRPIEIGVFAAPDRL